MSKKFLQSVEDLHPPCRDENPEMFFPGVGEDRHLQERRAKKVCQSCPIVIDCLEFALHTDDRWAIMGNTTPTERLFIKARREKSKELNAKLAELEFEAERKSWAA